MLKSRTLLFLLALFVSQNAFADCRLLSTTTDRCNENDNEVLQISGMGCYVCESDYCGSGHIVAAAGRATVRGSGGASYDDKIFECKRGGVGHDDKWVPIKDIPLCNGAEKRKNDSNAVKYLFNIKQGTSYDITSGASVSVASASDVCFDYKCNNGYTRVEGTDVCVQNNSACTYTDNKKYSAGAVFENQDCTAINNFNQTTNKLTSLNHLISGAKCKAVCENGGWNITLNADSCATNYEPDPTKKKCVESAAVRQQRQRREQDQRDQRQAAKEKCENSGGSYSGGKCTCDANNNLRLSGSVCVCTDSNYEFDSGSKTCKLTDASARRQRCEAATQSGAYWDGTVCKCSDNTKEWNGTTCAIKADIAQCNAIADASWNAAQNKCVCKDSKKEVNAEGTACVETEDARREREAAAQAAAIASATSKITKSAGVLGSMSEGFKVSVWKDKDGGFNTARLASDSIAGVVLGTAGGLITSNVVKKNQVKSGFENIQCTVGGQVVADWGDEFRVGIQ